MIYPIQTQSPISAPETFVRFSIKNNNGVLYSVKLQVCADCADS